VKTNLEEYNGIHNNIITYNPYKNETFVYKEGGEPIYAAKEVDMINSTNKLFVVKK